CMSVMGTGVASVSLTWSISGATNSTLRWRRPTTGRGSMAGVVTRLAMAPWPFTWVTAFQVRSKIFLAVDRPLVPPREAVRISGGGSAAGVAGCGEADAVVSR